MSRFISRFSRLHPVVHFGVGTGLMVLSGLLISAHVSTIIEVRDIAVPIVGELPRLERRLRSLQEQIELTQLHAATRVGSQEEKVEVYAFPEETDVSRLIATFEIIRETLQREGMLSAMSDIEVGEPQSRGDGSTARALSAEFTVHEDGLKTVLLLVRLAGLLTVGDVLSEDELQLLIARVEQENPAGIVALELFLGTDLLNYAEDPKVYEEQLKRSFGSTLFLNAFQNVLRTSLLHDVRILLHSDLGEILRSYKLWPLQIMAIEEVSIFPGSAPKWHTLGLTLLVFSQES